MFTNVAYIETIPEKCRMCYTCVRECPAKAIRILDGQAKVIGERCIACGNCVRVCSQNAKVWRSSKREVVELLESGHRVAAILAPSFPAEFHECDYRRTVGMVRAIGFHVVAEVGFGADLVAQEYVRLLTSTNGRMHRRKYIATTCPAVVGFVERYYPDMVKHLAPIVSPMVAMARALHRVHGRQLRIVFIGPCIAKKIEADSKNLKDDVDEVLTFIELRELLDERGIEPDHVTPSEFDPPEAGLGGLFSIARGLLQAGDIREDLTTGDVVAAEGRGKFIEAIREFSIGQLNARLLEVLCCDGCIMGAGMSGGDTHLFNRRNRVSEYVRRHHCRLGQQQWRKSMAEFVDLDLERAFHANDMRMASPSREQIQEVLLRMGKRRPEDELNCGACGYDTCVEHAIAILKGLAETEMCLPHTIEQLRATIRELAVSHETLTHTQETLIHTEKLASMGQLAAGIAHEVNNPLGVVLMYANLLRDEHLDNSKLKEDLSLIAEHAERCKKIVAGLLHFARKNKTILARVNIRDLIRQAVDMLPIDKNVRVTIRHLEADPAIELDSDQIKQVMTNLVTNACQAMDNQGELTVETDDDNGQLLIRVRDTGCGIAPENIKKIFDPFYTTKQIGQGTGLGLAITYGIIKMHKGDIVVQSDNDSQAGPTGTTVTVKLPRKTGKPYQP